MIPYTLPLADPRADLETAGGKGMSLARMLQAGLPVPGGFHITTGAYRTFVEANGLQARILAALEGARVEDPALLEEASRRIHDGFAGGSIPAAVADEIAAAYATLRNAPVAVRSSATAEDLPGASFAGQQETYLNICGEGAVLAAVQKCWASLWTARAIAYRLKNAIDQGSVSLAVVVQELVFADAAGILFTANPVSGSRDELVINAAWGLGEAVVSGAVTPDTLTVHKAGVRVSKREVADKQVMTVRTETGTQEQPVPEGLRKKAVLSDSQAAELARLGVTIEQYYGMPMDVEWVLARGQFSIVQARPITALPVEWKVPVAGAMFARGSLAEHLPGPVTPLFATLGLEIANRATAKMWERVVGPGAGNLMAGEGFYVPLHGYVYGGIKFGAKELLKVTRMSLSQIGPMFRGSVPRWQRARQELSEVVAGWEGRQLERLRAADLLDGFREVFGAACHYFTEIQTTLPAASSSEVLFGRLYNSLIRRKQDPEATVFLLGFETAALRAEKSLFDISQWVKLDPSLAAYVKAAPVEAMAAALEQAEPPEGVEATAWQDWQARVREHQRAFGRTAYEFDFANPTPAETPGPALEAIRGYLEGKARSPYERQREAAGRREQATLAVLQRTGWPRKGLFLKLLRWAQETSPMREDSIFDMGMGHPLLRRMLGELGRRFAGGGAIQQAEDIYWLEKPEVLELAAALDAGEPLPDLSGAIPERKEQWQAALKLSPPVMLPEKSRWNKMIHGGEAETRDGKTVLKGVGTSGGKARAPACVLYGPEDFHKLKPGDVLVAVTTTPAWTPLFAMASAVVTDIGGPLSHSSIVAREYGIPAVMAARGATRLIHNGQMVTVDGSAGTVTLE